MSFEAIVFRIMNDASLKAQSIIEEEKEEQKKLLEKHREIIENRYVREKKKLDLHISELEKRLVYHVNSEAERKVAGKKRAIIDEIIIEAVDDLVELDNKEYLELIRKIISKVDLKGNIEVIISPRDERRITETLLEKLSDKERKFLLSKEYHNDKGGIILRKGNISINATFSMFALLAHENLVMKLSSEFLEN